MKVEVSLVPMPEVDFSSFSEAHLKEYARDRALTDYEPYDTAERLARLKFNDLLPNGMRTREHYFYRALNGKKEQVGSGWLKVEKDSGIAWLYYIFVDPRFRGKGYGRRLLESLQRQAKELGARVLWLNVFEDNVVARNLYGSSGMKCVARHFNMLL